MNNLSSLIARAFIVALVLFGAPEFPPSSVGTGWAQDPWRNDFDAVCAKTQDAMLLSAEELKSLVDRCDALRPRLEKLAGPERKVSLKRLQMCRDLYAFVLQSRESR